MKCVRENDASFMARRVRSSSGCFAYPNAYWLSSHARIEHIWYEMLLLGQSFVGIGVAPCILSMIRSRTLLHDTKRHGSVLD